MTYDEYKKLSKAQRERLSARQMESVFDDIHRLRPTFVTECNAGRITRAQYIGSMEALKNDTVDLIHLLGRVNKPQSKPSSRHPKKASILIGGAAVDSLPDYDPKRPRSVTQAIVGVIQEATSHTATERMKRLKTIVAHRETVGKVVVQKKNLRKGRMKGAQVHQNKSDSEIVEILRDFKSRHPKLDATHAFDRIVLDRPKGTKSYVYSNGHALGKRVASIAAKRHMTAAQLYYSLRVSRC